MFFVFFVVSFLCLLARKPGNFFTVKAWSPTPFRRGGLLKRPVFTHNFMFDQFPPPSLLGRRALEWLALVRFRYVLRNVPCRPKRSIASSWTHASCCDAGFPSWVRIETLLDGVVLHPPGCVVGQVCFLLERPTIGRVATALCCFWCGAPSTCCLGLVLFFCWCFSGGGEGGRWRKERAWSRSGLLPRGLCRRIYSAASPLY